MGKVRGALATELPQVSLGLLDRSSVVDKVEQFLRALITRGTLKPGQRIVETRIAHQLGIGQPAVREALKTLEAEGLVVRYPNRGCTVVKLSLPEFRQLFRLRIEWECLAVNLAMENWSDAKTLLLSSSLDQLKAAAQQENVIEPCHNDLEFHRTLWRLSGNPFLERALNRVTVPLIAFLTIRRIAGDWPLDRSTEVMTHEQTALAVMSGDKQRAVTTIRSQLEEHCRWGVELFARP